MTKTVTSAGPSFFPDLAQRPEFQAEVDAAMAAIRGLAMLRFVEDPEVVERLWRRTKRRMMQIFVAEQA